MMKGSQGRKLKAGIVAETMRNAAYWLVSCDLLIFLSYRNQGWHYL